MGRVQIHEPNVSHPLFDYLANEETKPEMIEFIKRQTPFDIYFGDLVTIMMVGVYGKAKIEMAKNFWYEMGEAKKI